MPCWLSKLDVLVACLLSDNLKGQGARCRVQILCTLGRSWELSVLSWLCSILLGVVFMARSSQLLLHVSVFFLIPMVFRGVVQLVSGFFQRELLYM